MLLWEATVLTNRRQVATGTLAEITAIPVDTPAGTMDTRVDIPAGTMDTLVDIPVVILVTMGVATLVVDTLVVTLATQGVAILVDFMGVMESYPRPPTNPDSAQATVTGTMTAPEFKNVVEATVRILQLLWAES